MTSKLSFLIWTIFIFAVSVNGSRDDGYGIVDDCEDMSVNCICGIGENKRTITVKQKAVAVQTELGTTECKSPFDPYLLCADFSCFVSVDQAANIFAGGNDLKKRRNIVESFYPQEITIKPTASGDVSDHRFARGAEPCAIPALKNAEIKCWKWPNWMNCDVTCIHGYALQEQKESVKSVNLNCRSTENVWKPHGFEDCQPYVNCKAHLVKPGDLKCKEPTDGPAYCEISCLDYDEFEATSLQRYECVDDTFARILPHCATLKDVPLIRKPN